MVVKSVLFELWALPGTGIELPVLAWAFLAVLAIVVSTFLLKKIAGAETFFWSFSIIRSQRLTKTILALERFGPIVSILSEIGLVLGFGVFASDFLYGRKRNKIERIAIAIATASALFLFYSFTFFNSFEVAPALNPFKHFLVLVFSVFGISGFMVLLLSIMAFGIIVRFFAGQPSCPNIAPLIPGVQLPQVPFVVPVYAWIGIFFAMIVHEASHGIKAVYERVKVKSSGLLAIGFFPIGAFVEPDEEMLKAVSERARAGVFAAGPAANLASMVPVLVLILLFGMLFFVPAKTALEKAYLEGVSHVQIVGVDENLPFCGNPQAPAHGKLQPGMKVLQVNDVNIRTTSDLQIALRQKPFQKTRFLVDLNGEIREIFITPHQETSYFGFQTENVMKSGFVLPEKEFNNYYWIALFFDILQWILLISFLLATANFLPVPIFDGGQIAVILYSPLLKPFIAVQEKREKIVKGFFYLLLFVLFAVNALPFFL
ncbi:MAG: site-2 protease family protein [Candidatus Diapherotrites archaeon]